MLPYFLTLRLFVVFLVEPHKNPTIWIRALSNYWKHTYEQSFDFINSIVSKLKNSPFEEYHTVADSLVRWKQEICNSYLLVGGKRITNARTEGFNNLVKVIKRCGYGYSNFKRFRSRILHIQKSNNKLKLY